MSEIFSEGKIGDIILKNKIIRSATHEAMGDEKGNPSELLFKKYSALAKGDVGMIITGYAGVSQEGKTNFKDMLMIDIDDVIESFKKLTDEIHSLNTKIVMQIAHCGAQTSSKITKHKTVAPSEINSFLYSEKPKELTEDEIENIINDFVNAIRRVKQAGFDGVQLHIAHGYLLSAFVSPFLNQRNDKWGGNEENRFRIIKEILVKAKKENKDFPILAKINCFEKNKKGIKLNNAIKVAQMLEENGCDGIEVSCGTILDGFSSTRGGIPIDGILKYLSPVKDYPKIIKKIMKPFMKIFMKSETPVFLYNVDSAAEIKKNVNIPVIVVGGIRKLSEIEDIITNKKADFVSMSRPFIIEPNIIKKFKENIQTESKCLNCNFCICGIESETLKCFYGKLK